MISVIVPVYNVEEYLEECLESIQKQTYSNIEVILVNDGSTDRSKEICEQYCEKDSRFKLVNQENKGLSGARNRGMLESKGEFISFVDSDDVLKEDMLEQLIKQMTSEDIDIVECWYTNEKQELELSTPKNVKIIFQGNMKEAIVSLCKDNIVRLNAVAKLFRRQVIVNFPFLEGLFLFTICDKLEQLYQGDTYSLAYIHRRLFHLVLMHVVDYHIFEGNPYKEKYVEYLNRYARASSRSLVMRAYHFFPQNIVFISRVAGAIQWRVEKYFIKGLWKGMK